MVPESIDKILYLDCDIIINDSLSDLWNIDMKGCTIAAVEDVASCVFQSETGIDEKFRYFCSGVILIDLKKWRDIKVQEKLLKYLDSRNGIVRHHDQTILNGVFWNDCFMLHPRYDALSPTFIMSYENLKAYFKLWDRYYTKKEIRESIKNPAIIHYTSSNIGRPWENKAHPLSYKYKYYWDKSPWKDAPWGTFKPTYDKVQRRTYWLYQHVPVKIINFVAKKNKG
ncbi:General stress protein A [bioreactor metagenome]|uniref:General stress protein A n=1 Tax=bioreactor metagenome TaxID=1076179 RepID=A0A645D8U1_9ZZZZ